ncbi:unnamed protein product [Leptosia nina]|uniref:Transmembrane protein 183 n=1 Tax=Leptosia nina TaxID=320188 RepID=A0AAV1IXQ3_9NEOP
MPKKKGQKKAKQSTIYYCIKEQQNEDSTIDDVDIKKNKSKNRHQVHDDSDTEPGVFYPEIVWYLISVFIEPADIGTFARICKATYNITKRESFWLCIYNLYCRKDKRLPERLRIEENYRAYGLRQRVIRALYYTYDPFVVRTSELEHKMTPQSLLKRNCVNTWYNKLQSHWIVYLKFRKHKPINHNMINNNEGRVDANTEQDTKVLQIWCKHVYNIPPLMGMTLSTFSLSYLSPGLKLEMGFSSPHDAGKCFPSQIVVLDSVIKWYVYDWWHPKYPHFEVRPPPLSTDEDNSPLLDVDFFDMSDED